MKDSFPGYYRPTENEFAEMWESCLFVLDANVLLNLYRYSVDTREERCKPPVPPPVPPGRQYSASVRP